MAGRDASNEQHCVGVLVATRSQDGKRVPQQMRWGLFPGGQRTLRSASPPSTPGRRRSIPPPAFRDAWRKGQRCLVVTDGFYEWKKPEKQPYAVAMADKSHMVMAGLWDEWTDKKTGERIKKALLVPFKDDALTKWPVSRQKIGNVRNKDREVASPEVLA